MFEMFGTVIRNLFSKPATRMYPVEKRPAFENARGQVSGIDVEACIYCGICQKKCPALAINVDKPSKTWTLDPYKCVICGVCVEACPKHCIGMDTQYHAPVYRKEKLVLVKPEQPVEVPEEALTGSTRV